MKLRDELGLPPRIVSLEKTPTSHPNHPFTWTSANMWCYSCSGECHSCRRPCCAFYQQLSIAFGNTTTVTEKMAAEQMIRKIIALNPSGPDIAGTFLPCSSCSKTLCPDCCGICPDIMCRDVQCRNCKSDPWAECDWH